MAPAPDAAVTAEQLAAATKVAALNLGFDACGITDLSPNRTKDAFDDWLAKSFHGEMGYMERQARVRREPALAWAAAKSVVVVLHNYYCSAEYLSGTAKVARYAQGDDYHIVTRNLLELLSGDVFRIAGGGSFRYYVDAGPIPERELAARSGLGWIGKNTMLIHPKIGSFTFIGCLLTDLALAPDQPFEADRCGSCTRCLEACPTDAFVRPRVLDATRCVSYLTIEARAEIPDSLREGVGDNLFGCDICQDVCPWNVKFARETTEPRFLPPRPDLRPKLESIEQLDDAEFARIFGRSPIERARLTGLKRNARVVLENRKRRSGL